MLAALALALAASVVAPLAAPPAGGPLVQLPQEQPVLQPDGPLVQRPRIDVAFVLDSTGSMADEIDVVKERIVEIARKIGTGQPRPDVRFGLVAYRDRGDAYLTRVSPFTRALAEVKRALDGISADGGGDEPEAVAEGLFVAVHELAWDKAPGVTRMMFLIGDAGPQQYVDGKDWRKVTAEAKQAGITIHTIGCSGLNAWADGVFARIAHGTGGELAHLTYRGGTAVASDGKRRDVLRAGSKTYVAEGALSADEWKKGAEALAAAGKVREVDSSTAARMGVASAAPAGASKPSDLNNLDAEIVGRVMKAAEAKGVAYH